MAWALQFDGVNDYAELSSMVQLSGDFEVEVKFKVKSGSSANVLRTNITQNQWIGRWNGNHLLYWGSVLITHPVLSLDTDYVYRIVRTGSNIDWYINDTLAETSTNANDLYLRDIFKVAEGQIQFLKITDGATLIHNLDSNQSDRSGSTNQPIITDTIGGNNATGVNFPPFDASVWVDLGGGGVELNITESLNSFQDSSLLNVSYNVSAIITEQLSSFSDSSHVNLTLAQSISIAVTEVLGSFSDLSLLNVSQTAGVDISVTELLNSFSDGSNVTISKDITLDVTEILTDFSDNSSVKLPVTWSVKQSVETIWGVKDKSSTIWIKKG